MGRGKPVLLVFAGADCGVCHLVLPDVGRWQATLSDRLSVMVLASGPVDDNRAMAEEFGLSELLLQDSYEVMNSYRVHATPGAVLLDAEGRIASETAVGPPSIEPLVRVALGQGPSGPASPLALVVQQPGD